jgi:polyisoprenoid-binding protein YceI
MRISEWKSVGAAVCAMVGIALILSAMPAPPRYQTAQSAVQEIVLELDPSLCKVHYSVDSTLHMVHGTFNLKSGTVRFDPSTGKASGEVSVYATSGDSGNNGRDERMHKEILETQKYPDALFRPTQVEGTVARSGASEVKLHGVMLLHGGEHEIVVAVHAEQQGNHWNGTAKFEVPYTHWGMKDASTWLLKVKPVVHVELEMAGTAGNPN